MNLENNMEENTIKPQGDSLQTLIAQEVKRQLASNLFSARKITDTPTDALMVVNRRYVTLNGVSSSRPTSSVVGQQYFDTTLASGRGKPITWNGTGFVDATGSYV